MSQKMAAGTHDRFQKSIGPIHEEISQISLQMNRLRGERAILQAMAAAEFEKAGVSKEAVSQLAAACW